MLNPMEAALLLVDFQSRLADIVNRKELVVPMSCAWSKAARLWKCQSWRQVQVPEKLGPALPELDRCAGGRCLCAESCV